MMCTQKIEIMFSILKTVFWLGFFVFQPSSSSDVATMEVTAKAGDLAMLPCSLKIPPGKSLKDYNVYWQKPVPKNGNELVVIGYHYGQERPDWTDLVYQNRTTMDQRNFTLWISPVKVSDQGQYKCLILNPEKNYEAHLKLSVVADFSKPSIEAVFNPPCAPTVLTLSCSSQGGYPQPEMSGLINNESVKWDHSSISDNQTQLFNITGNYNWQCNMTGEIFVQCSVGYLGFEVSSSLSLRTPECPPPEQPSSNGIVIVSIVILTFFVVMIVLTIFLRHRTCRHPRSSQHITSHQPVATSEMTSQQLSNGASGTRYAQPCRT
ncbi:T-lymphocyte activation antigen CD80-like [Hemicordylus capensis]|uniref:T-lymphocyte activation antigen CD80-like n=1 Tax=Hemicordylus capensis TaxID=884348 RepID=UPI002303B38E|nr:T-lymphocyte activation antigen CD80-like [Hemicordylus capensis]XP_053165400.1 T-lymphocyte activation antigen CD80-like [Hemicordylus capensis]XP_053165401.1 T-lymphocyte activation antigen CD80-like [Hemicordylus capensis]XP_053165402.1 T-lymphocyte activation antigen CD80-like [Hemicordylus capensis]